MADPISSRGTAGRKTGDAVARRVLAALQAPGIATRRSDLLACATALRRVSVSRRALAALRQDDAYLDAAITLCEAVMRDLEVVSALMQVAWLVGVSTIHHYSRLIDLLDAVSSAAVPGGGEGAATREAVDAHGEACLEAIVGTLASCCDPIVLSFGARRSVERTLAVCQTLGERSPVVVRIHSMWADLASVLLHSVEEAAEYERNWTLEVFAGRSFAQPRMAVSQNERGADHPAVALNDLIDVHATFVGSGALAALALAVEQAGVGDETAAEAAARACIAFGCLLAEHRASTSYFESDIPEAWQVQADGNLEDGSRHQRLNEMAIKEQIGRGAAPWDTGLPVALTGVHKTATPTVRAGDEAVVYDFNLAVDDVLPRLLNGLHRASAFGRTEATWDGVSVALARAIISLCAPEYAHTTLSRTVPIINAVSEIFAIEDANCVGTWAALLRVLTIVQYAAGPQLYVERIVQSWEEDRRLEDAALELDNALAPALALELCTFYHRFLSVQRVDRTVFAENADPWRPGPDFLVRVMRAFRGSRPHELAAIRCLIVCYESYRGAMPSDDVVEVFVPFMRSHYGDREATLLGIALAKLVIGDVPQDLAVFHESSAFKRRLIEVLFDMSRDPKAAVRTSWRIAIAQLRMWQICINTPTMRVHTTIESVNTLCDYIMAVCSPVTSLDCGRFLSALLMNLTTGTDSSVPRFDNFVMNTRLLETTLAVLLHDEVDATTEYDFLQAIAVQCTKTIRKVSDREKAAAAAAGTAEPGADGETVTAGHAVEMDVMGNDDDDDDDVADVPPPIAVAEAQPAVATVAVDDLPTPPSNAIGAEAERDRTSSDSSAESSTTTDHEEVLRRRGVVADSEVVLVVN